MKKILIIVICLGCSCSKTISQTKRALIVAIANYPNPYFNGWPVINSLRDLEMIKATLLKQDFPLENITELTDNHATKRGILDAFEKLYRSSGSGDIVVIHFSAHGVQLEDNDLNEELDLLDECIVPFDAVYKENPKDYQLIQGKYLRDDDIAEFVTRLRNKLGKEGNVLLIFDACHSGTMAKGLGDTVRGPHDAIVSLDWNKRKLGAKPDTGVLNEKTKTILNKDAASYVAISASEAQQNNRECKNDENNSMGSLSYAFCKAMEVVRPGATYNILYSIIENIMSQKVPDQSPTIEGDGANKLIFSNKYKYQKPYLLIDTVKSSGDKIILNGGSLWGITEGSKVGFYDIQTLDPAGKTALATGKVTTIRAFDCTVALDKPNKDLVKLNPKAFITEFMLEKRRLRLGIFDVTGKPALQTIIEKFKNIFSGFELVTFSNDFDYYLQPDPGKKTWRLYKRNGNPADFIKNNISITDSIEVNKLKELLRFMDKADFLKNLDIQEKGISAIVDLVFLMTDGNRTQQDTLKFINRYHNKRLELVEGDSVYIRIRNTCDQLVYFNIMDIQPDGKIISFYPNKWVLNIQAGECIINRKESKILPIQFVAGNPFGMETLKIFLSDKKLDLEDILATQNLNQDIDPAKKGMLQDIEKIFLYSEVNRNGKKGDPVGIDKDQSGTIFSYNFIVKKKSIN
jgi:metacaspase-1